MHEFQWLAERFEADRTHLRSVAYRMLGSLSEAEDAVQQARLRLSRSGVGEVENLGGWMTTVVARVCLDMLRSRRSRREHRRSISPASATSWTHSEPPHARETWTGSLVLLDPEAAVRSDATAV